MTKEEIRFKTLWFFETLNIKSFPFSTKSILQQLGIKVLSYSNLQKIDKELYAISLKFSKDAFTFQNTVCYNDKMPHKRIRFSLMHELGHILLKSTSEKDADLFASYVLAPRIILYHASHFCQKEFNQLFKISSQAFAIAWSDYIHNYKGKEITTLSTANQQLYHHFYHTDLDFFVFHIDECDICGNEIYNSFCQPCIKCRFKHSYSPHSNPLFYKTEQDWLYPE